MQRLRPNTWLMLGVFFMVNNLGYAYPAGPQNSAAQESNSGVPMGQQSQSRNSADQDKQPASATAANEMDALKSQLKQQQEEIEKLRVALERQAQLLERVTAPQQATTPVPSAANVVPVTADQSKGQVASLKPLLPSAVMDEKKSEDAPLPISMVTPAATAVAEGLTSSGQQLNPAVSNSPEAPISVRIGRAEFTPVGFMDATAFFRSTNLGSGIGTSFGSLPFSNTPQGRLTETRLTIQNSRIGMMVESTVGDSKLRGYWESDFLGAQPGNAFVTSNSDSFRMRLFWLDLTHGKFEFLAGQSWSMLTPNRVGISPVPSDIFYSQDMDTNYQVGLTWSRQLQFRFLYHPSKDVTMGLSLENPDQYVGNAVVLPSNFSSSQVDTSAATNSANTFPDVIGKIAFDAHAGGKLEHIEFAGLMTQFKTYSPVTNNTASVTGGGASINFSLELVKNFHAILTTFYSDGGGRYIFGLGPAMMVHPDQTPGLVHSSSMTGGFEYTASPGVLLYGYYGGTFYARTYDVIPATSTSPVSYVGYGFAGSSSSANKTVQEGTFGIIRTFWKNPHYGALQLITQYSYLTRAPWYLAINSPKNAHLSMAYVDLRYVLP
ncbi:MAG: hypothetical protein ACRD2O_03320 [Terriglobia bacterium]